MGEGQTKHYIEWWGRPLCEGAILFNNRRKYLSLLVLGFQNKSRGPQRHSGCAFPIEAPMVG